MIEDLKIWQSNKYRLLDGQPYPSPGFTTIPVEELVTGKILALRTQIPWSIEADARLRHALDCFNTVVGDKQAAFHAGMLLPLLAYHPPGEFGEEGYLVTGWPGTTLARLLEKKDVTNIDGARLIDSILSGLGAIHRAGNLKLVHNALSDASIYVSADLQTVQIGNLEFVSKEDDPDSASLVLPQNAEFAPPEFYRGDLALEQDPMSIRQE